MSAAYDAETNERYQRLLHGLQGFQSPEEFAQRLSPEMLTTDYDIWFGYFVRHAWEDRLPGEAEALQFVRHVVHRCAVVGVATACDEFFGPLPESMVDHWTRLGEILSQDAPSTDEVIARRSDVIAHPAFGELCAFLRSEQLQGLAVAYHERYRARREPADLEAALARVDEDYQGSPEDWPFDAGALAEASVCLLDRYEREQSLRDLDLAVANAEMAITVALPNVLEMSQFYSAYGSALLEVYNARQDRAALEAAVMACEQAAALAQPGSERRAKYLDNLAVARQHAAH